MKGFSILAGVLISTGFCLADGGVVIARQVVNGFDVTVFASPVPLRAGPMDVSVLVQDPESGKAVLDAAVTVSWSSKSSASPDWLPPCCTMTDGREAIPARRGHSQNQFLYSAFVPIRSSGASELVVRMKSGGREAMISSDLEVLPPGHRPWPIGPSWPSLPSLSPDLPSTSG